uniref:Uncharacterized protein n=1 Tax=Rhizophora mucronata TaxID=61149 RepID=A0A2P2Q4T7_RHIMU
MEWLYHARKNKNSNHKSDWQVKLWHVKGRCLLVV